MEGYRFETDHVELAIVRRDLRRIERILADWRPEGFWEFDGVVAWMNALMTLDRRDEIEQEAPSFLKPGTYLEPFVLRALGSARRDEALVAQAAERFDEIGLRWHADETRRIAKDRRPS